MSAGCENCYAERQAHRYSGKDGPYEGLTVISRKGPRWSGLLMKVPKHLDDPLRWRRPRLVFVNSMSDLFFEALDFEYTAAIFAVMAASPRHTFQVLTKRPERAAEFFAWLEEKAASRASMVSGMTHDEARSGFLLECAQAAGVTHKNLHQCDLAPWPLPNVWLGVSASNQATADVRIPILLTLPAAVRWVSYEPGIGPIDFDDSRDWFTPSKARAELEGREVGPSLDWVVVGGESGPRARPFDLAWARSVVRQAEGTSTRVFVKQLGAVPVDTTADRNTALREHRYQPVPVPVELAHPKGGDPSEWPEDLRVREWPEAA